MMNKGRVFILSGPSGSGKDTVLGKVFEAQPEMRLSISSVTRQMRSIEEAKKYNFISREAFEKLIENGELLEYNLYMDNYYGSPRRPVENWIAEGRDVVLEVDVNGAANIRKNIEGTVSIFIMPPSFEVLRERLSGRGTEPAEVVEKRLNQALEEIERADEFDYIVINDHLDEAVEELLSIVLSERLRLDRRNYIIEEVLKNAESGNR